MAGKRFHLSAKISSDSPRAIRPSLDQFIGATGEIREQEDGFAVEAELTGESARDLNRALLSSLRRAEKRTRLRAEWTSGGLTERFFDYVPKGTRTDAPLRRVTGPK